MAADPSWLLRCFPPPRQLLVAVDHVRQLIELLDDAAATVDVLDDSRADERRAWRWRLEESLEQLYGELAKVAMAGWPVDPLDDELYSEGAELIANAWHGWPTETLDALLLASATAADWAHYSISLFGGEGPFAPRAPEPVPEDELSEMRRMITAVYDTVASAATSFDAVLLSGAAATKAVIALSAVDTDVDRRGTGERAGKPETTPIKAGETFGQLLETDPETHASWELARVQLSVFAKAMQEAMQGVSGELAARHFAPPESIEDWEHLAGIIGIPWERIQSGKWTAREVFDCAKWWADRKKIEVKLTESAKRELLTEWASPTDARNKFCFEQWEHHHATLKEIRVSVAKRPEWEPLADERSVRGPINAWAKKIGATVTRRRAGRRPAAS